MPKIQKRTEKQKAHNGQIHINFDITMLNALIKYTRCIGWVKRPQLDALLKLLRKLDLNTYNYDEDMQLRIKLIIAICSGTIEENISDPDVLEMYVKEQVPDGIEILMNVGLEVNKLNKSECDTIERAISERLQYSYLYSFKENLSAMYEEIEKPGFHSYAEAVNTLKSSLTNLMASLEMCGASDDMIKEFSFSGYLYSTMMDKIVARAKKESTILKTGMRCMNAMLSPGFEGSRLYVYLGGTGKGKSGVLLNIADQIRLFNPQIIPVESGIRKTVVFITMENTINETIERLFDMYNDTGIAMKYLDPEEVKRILREKGRFSFDDENGIDIDILYYADLEIATSDLYNLWYRLRDMGKEPIALVLDYILKIDSARDNNNDERLRLTYSAKELKSFAQVFDIPVITAMQFNREGNSIIDAATRDEKEGILNFVGPALIGTAWGLVQEADWVGSLNLERRRSTNTNHMSFKLYKIRGKKDDMMIDYFNHPFIGNSLRLMPDVDKEKTVSMILNASDLESVDEEKESNYGNSAQKRPKLHSQNEAPPNIMERMDFASFKRIA